MGYNLVVPPWGNIEVQQRICEICGSGFATKRTAKYCSNLCRNRARPLRPHNPESRRQQYLKRVADPDRKARYNAAANTRIRSVKEWISAYKTGHGCVDCGYNAHPAALDIDHMAGKTANISALKSIAAVRAEIDRHKCVVRCANCHRIKSWKTRTWEVHDSTTSS